MDANDLYRQITDVDPYGHVRAVVDALDAQDVFLGDEERSFLSGVHALMALNEAITPATEQHLKQLLTIVRQRIHTGGG